MSGFTKITLTAVVAIMVLATAVPVCATVWDMAADFSTVDNPNGPWSYGFLNYPNTYREFVPYYGATTATTGTWGQVDGWGAWMSGATAKNVTGGDFTVPPGTWWVKKDGMYIMPTSGYAPTGYDPGLWNDNSNMIAQRWTSPVAGTVHIYGKFYGITTMNFDPPKWTQGGVLIHKGTYPTPNPSQVVLHQDMIDGSVAGGGYPGLGSHAESFFDIFVDVNIGDPIVFAAGNVGSWADSRFGIDATIEVVPEPGSLLALGGGLFGALGFAIRRRK